MEYVWIVEVLEGVEEIGVQGVFSSQARANAFVEDAKAKSVTPLHFYVQDYPVDGDYEWTDMEAELPENDQ